MRWESSRSCWGQVFWGVGAIVRGIATFYCHLAHVPSALKGKQGPTAMGGRGLWPHGSWCARCLPRQQDWGVNWHLPKHQSLQHTSLLPRAGSMTWDSAVGRHSANISFLWGKWEPFNLACSLLLYIYIYFWLRWVFIAEHGLSLVAANGGYSSLRCVGFLLQWLLLLWSTGSRRPGFGSCSTQAQ